MKVIFFVCFVVFNVINYTSGKTAIVNKEGGFFKSFSEDYKKDFLPSTGRSHQTINVYLYFISNR